MEQLSVVRILNVMIFREFEAPEGMIRKALQQAGLPTTSMVPILLPAKLTHRNMEGNLRGTMRDVHGEEVDILDFVETSYNFSFRTWNSEMREEVAYSFTKGEANLAEGRCHSDLAGEGFARCISFELPRELFNFPSEPPQEKIA